MSMYPGITPLWELYEVHLDEAEYLEGQWERALRAPDKRWPQVTAREHRLLAHVDALALGGSAVAWRLLRPALASEEVPRVTAAALALLADGGESGREAVLESFLEGPPEPRPGLQRALELCEREDVLVRLTAPLRSPDTEPSVLSAVLAVHVAQGYRPAGDVPLEGLLAHPAPSIAAAAFQVLPTLAPLPVSSRQRLVAALHSPAPGVRDAALMAGMVMGLRETWTRCRQLVEVPELPGRLPLLLAALGGEARDIERLVARLGDAGPRADVIWALGHSGRVVAAEACLALVDAPDVRVARLATESFAAVTGFPLEGHHVMEEEESGEEPSAEESEAPDADRDAEEALPRASPEVARIWWKREQKRFELRTRYLGGVAFSATSLARAFGTFPARRWPALALELTIRSRGRHSLDARAFSYRLQQRLQAVSGFAPRGEQPFASFLDQ